MKIKGSTIVSFKGYCILIYLKKIVDIQIQVSFLQFDKCVTFL